MKQTIFCIAALCIAAILCPSPIQAQFSIVIEADPYKPYEMSWELLDETTGLPVAGELCGDVSGGVTTHGVNLIAGNTYTFNAYDDWGDGWNGGNWSVVDSSCLGTLASGYPMAGYLDFDLACINSVLVQSKNFTVLTDYNGCTDPAAINYNPCANLNDGSCVYSFSYPKNDNCDSAFFVPVNAYCVKNASNVGATFSAAAGPINPVCGGSPVDSAVSDIWFVFEAPLSGEVEISFEEVAGHYVGLQFYQGSCAALNQIGSCQVSHTGATLTLDSLPPGSDIFMRLWDPGNDETGDYSFCINSIETVCDGSVPPANFAHSFSGSTLDLTWDVVPASIGCKLKYGPVGSSLPLAFQELTYEMDGLSIPAGIIAPGVYEMKVRCACQVSPLIITASSNTITVAIPAARSVENSMAAAIEVFPNPANTTIQLGYNGGGEEVKIEVLDALGKLHFSTYQWANPGKNSRLIDVSSLNEGLYYMRILSVNAVQSSGFQVVR